MLVEVKVPQLSESVAEATLLTWRKNAPEVEVICVPARSQFYAHDGPRASLEQVRAIAQEYVAIAAYWWKGWI